MKQLLFILLFLTSIQFASAQKKIIDKDVCDNWVSLQELGRDGSIISSDGRFIAYQYGSKKEGNTLVVQELKGPYKVTFPGAGKIAFTADDQRMVVLLPTNDLVIQTLGKHDPINIKRVESFILPEIGNGRFLLYKKRAPDQIHVLRDLYTGIESSYQAEAAWFNNSGTVLVVKTDDGLLWVDPMSGKEELVPQSRGAIKPAFENSNHKLAFVAKENAGYVVNCYDRKKGQTAILASDNSVGIEQGYSISDGPVHFTNDGDKVFFCVKQIENKKANKESVITNAVNVWTYKDRELQAAQLSPFLDRKNRQFAAVANLGSGKVFQLENEVLQMSASKGNKFALLKSRVVDDEFYWNKERKALYLISLENGSRRKLFEDEYPAFVYERIAPSEKYVIWYDGIAGHYFSYEVKTGVIINITSGISVPLYKSLRGEADLIRNRGNCYGIAAWLKNDEGVLIYDRTDIWKVDLAGKKKSINVTNEYGKKNDITFRLVFKPAVVNVPEDENILLSAFDNRNKRNGFYTISLLPHADPDSCTLDNYTYFFNCRYPLVFAGAHENPVSFAPQKATSSNICVVRRMSSTEAPNLFYTNDFRTFHRITDINPQQEVKWYKSELVSWLLPDGLRCDGILHKPENFDPSKKYPVIFNYYEQRTEGLNIFHTPELAGHNINIPWYVSRDYLVFEPDIYYKTGKTAQSILDVVESAAKYLATLPYVDSKRMGVQGQSFGGYETNVIVTGSKLFAAACEMAGPTNIISEYGSIRPMFGSNNQSSADIGQRNLGVSPWERPEIFIENSPVFHIDRATTPLLIVHNQGDGAILYTQAIELFLGMRRAGKKVWMLEYDGEGHAIYDEKNKLDFTIRMQQFFDHYLKGMPAPKWMTKGVPATDKGIETGYELDPAENCGTTGHECEVCNKWAEQFKRNPAQFSRLVRQWQMKTTAPLGSL